MRADLAIMHSLPGSRQPLLGNADSVSAETIRSAMTNPKAVESLITVVTQRPMPAVLHLVYGNHSVHVSSDQPSTFRPRHTPLRRTAPNGTAWRRAQ